MATTRGSNAPRSSVRTGLGHDPRSVPGALYAALERLVKIEGGIAAAARRLKLPATLVKRWVLSGIGYGTPYAKKRVNSAAVAAYKALNYWDRTAKRRDRRDVQLRTTGEVADNKSLPGILRWSLERLVRIEGGYASAARRLEQSRQELFTQGRALAAVQFTGAVLRRWIVAGLPASFNANSPQFDDTLAVAYHSLAYWDESERQEERDEILEYSKLPEAARRLAARRLATMVDDNNKVSRLLGGRGHGVAVVAGRLGVTRAQLRGWISSGVVSRTGISKVLRWEEDQSRLYGPGARKDLNHLMSLARKEGTQVSGNKLDEYGNPAIVAADKIAPLKSMDGRLSSPARSGYEWTLRMGAYLNEASLAKMIAFALSVRVPNVYLRSARKWNRWMVTAVFVEYNPPGAPPVGKHKSDKDVVRQFGPDGGAHGGGEAEDNDKGRHMVINQGRSGAAQLTQVGAARSFRERIVDWMRMPVLCWVQGVIVGNWRDRTALEESDFRTSKWIAAGGGKKRPKAKPNKKNTGKAVRGRNGKAVKSKRPSMGRVPRLVDIDSDFPPPRKRRTKKKARK